MAAGRGQTAPPHRVLAELVWSLINRRVQSYSSLHELIPERRQVASGFRCRECGWACGAVGDERNMLMSMCWYMLNELSSKTPRSRTKSTASISTCPRRIVMSIACKLSSFARPPNQINSVFRVQLQSSLGTPFVNIGNAVFQTSTSRVDVLQLNTTPAAACRPRRHGGVWRIDPRWSTRIDHWSRCAASAARASADRETTSRVTWRRIAGDCGRAEVSGLCSAYVGSNTMTWHARADSIDNWMTEWVGTAAVSAVSLGDREMTTCSSTSRWSSCWWWCWTGELAGGRSREKMNECCKETIDQSRTTFDRLSAQCGVLLR